METTAYFTEVKDIIQKEYGWLITIDHEWFCEGQHLFGKIKNEFHVWQKATEVFQKQYPEIPLFAALWMENQDVKDIRLYIKIEKTWNFFYLRVDDMNKRDILMIDLESLHEKKHFYRIPEEKRKELQGMVNEFREFIINDPQYRLHFVTRDLPIDFGETLKHMLGYES